MTDTNDVTPLDPKLGCDQCGAVERVNQYNHWSTMVEQFLCDECAVDEPGTSVAECDRCGVTLVGRKEDLKVQYAVQRSDDRYVFLCGGCR